MWPIGTRPGCSGRELPSARRPSLSPSSSLAGSTRYVASNIAAGLLITGFCRAEEDHAVLTFRGHRADARGEHGLPLSPRSAASGLRDAGSGGATGRETIRTPRPRQSRESHCCDRSGGSPVSSRCWRTAVRRRSRVPRRAGWPMAGVALTFTVLAGSSPYSLDRRTNRRRRGDRPFSRHSSRATATHSRQARSTRGASPHADRHPSIAHPIRDQIGPQPPDRLARRRARSGEEGRWLDTMTVRRPLSCLVMVKLARAVGVRWGSPFPSSGGPGNDTSVRDGSVGAGALGAQRRAGMTVRQRDVSGTSGGCVLISSMRLAGRGASRRIASQRRLGPRK